MNPIKFILFNIIELILTMSCWNLSDSVGWTITWWIPSKIMIQTWTSQNKKIKKTLKLFCFEKKCDSSYDLIIQNTKKPSQSKSLSY
jgi:hypothetical protein